MSNHSPTIGGDLGRLFFIPILDNKKITAKAAVLAGMGEAGRFSRDDLRYLMTNITYGAAALGLKSFATVLIGSGEGNLSKERSLRGILDGLGDALPRLREAERVYQVTLVEADEETYRELSSLLQKLKREQTVSPLALEIRQRTLPSHRRRRVQKRERPANLPLPASSRRRITIERKGGRLLLLCSV
jgi:hypothetical protein